ncbi:sugar transferase [Polynucleobacter sp. JS-JIR-5-A7]|uniref:sugar transferase n=1 Tax=Polynucleobacter sp. JS-JIR-5-A7 TaxID=1758395 RepID=UPI001BFD6D80|nr:sugar transferase [Polynucleobacter sp. JS-JIR-5-A7]QWE06952.1 sugar transferase [Polynucleobacter sp. JS-JIR-5-A7]
MYILIFKRLFDIFFSIILIFFLSPLFLMIATSILLFDFGPILFFSDRVGINNHIFRMPKFRTMSTKTPVVATHILDNSEAYISRLGKILRKTSLDEIPQIFSILMGSMSFVGPRPALYNQLDLIQLRLERGVHKIRPGLTGLAQISGRDSLSLEEKADFDAIYSKNISFINDCDILFKTVFYALTSKNILH